MVALVAFFFMGNDDKICYSWGVITSSYGNGCYIIMVVVNVVCSGINVGVLCVMAPVYLWEFCCPFRGGVNGCLKGLRRVRAPCG